jgi:hypothetical protein
MSKIAAWILGSTLNPLIKVIRELGKGVMGAGDYSIISNNYRSFEGFVEAIANKSPI